MWHSFDTIRPALRHTALQLPRGGLPRRILGSSGSLAMVVADGGSLKA